MSKTPLSFYALVVLAGIASSLGGCGTINGYLAAGMSDYMPHWAGGLPTDAPPRPGTAKYDEFMKERERKRMEAAAPKADPDKNSSSSLDPVH
ncbi:hypothetical protein [uncultured Bradyrhizobium sp.]|uniref:hypothetical protein n=1 Tax=uncultured Bradyrhizobium sp. TaxID=199684 RepID=UPI0035CAF90F